MKHLLRGALTAAGLLLLAGCGGSKQAAPPVKTAAPPTATTAPAQLTPTPHPGITDTPVPTAAPTTTPTATSPTATATPSSGATAPHVDSASLTPASVPVGDALTASVSTSGSASQVEIYLSAGPGSALTTYNLGEDSPGTWSASITAPGTPGTYHYSVGVYDFHGHRVIADRDAWNITVTGGAPAGSGSGSGGGSGSAGSGGTGGGSTGKVQPLPGDIPLAPPFTYGNPQAADFTADGRTIQGSEVVSDSRPDVDASTVAQFYEDHLPRGGWAVAQSTVPPAGATAFTIVANNGNRVCVVQYAAGTVTIYYGTTG